MVKKSAWRTRRTHNPAFKARVWGSGTSKREFLYSDDMAYACVHLMNLPDAEFVPLLDQGATTACRR